MNLFRQHAQANQETAKKAYEQVARSIIAKYVISHEILNSYLVAGNDPMDKEGPCLMCKIDGITKKMAKLELQVGQITKTYRLAFGKELDIATITDEACERFYPMTTGKKEKSVEGMEEKLKGTDFTGGHPLFRELSVDEMPQELQDMIEKIKSGIEKKSSGKSVSVHLVGMKRPTTPSMEDMLAGETYGLDPKDYDGPIAFYKAVKSAAKAHRSSTTGHKPADVSMEESKDKSPLDEPISPKRKRNSDSEDKSGQN